MSTLWRRVAAATWDPPTQPTVYSKVSLDITQILNYLSNYEKQTGHKITLTLFFSWAVAKAISLNKDINCIVRAGDIVKLPTVDINLAVALPQSDQVWICKIRQADEMDLSTFSKRVQSQVEAIKKQADKELSSSYNWVVEYLPAWTIRSLISSFVTLETDWKFPVSWLGVAQREPFQPCSAAVSSVGTLNVEEAFPCFPTVQPTPLIFVLGAATLKPWVVDDNKIEPRPVMSVSVAADHRVVDGKLAAQFLRTLERVIEEAVGQKVFEHRIVSKL